MLLGHGELSLVLSLCQQQVAQGHMSQPRHNPSFPQGEQPGPSTLSPKQQDSDLLVAPSLDTQPPTGAPH